MTNRHYRMTDDEFTSFAKKHPNVSRSDVSALEDILNRKILADMALGAQKSEIESLKSKAIGTMGTNHEMKFSDIESGMLRASLSDGRQALKEIIDQIPTVTPTCHDGTKMKNQGRKKKRNDNSGSGRWN
jgi:hypothetical protein